MRSRAFDNVRVFRQYGVCGFEGARFMDSSGYYYYADRVRNQVNASISHYAEAFGKHDLKFGVEIERSKVHSQFGYTGGGYYYDPAPAPRTPRPEPKRHFWSWRRSSCRTRAFPGDWYRGKWCCEPP
jgi:hypothetical protein